MTDADPRDPVDSTPQDLGDEDTSLPEVGVTEAEQSPTDQSEAGHSDEESVDEEAVGAEAIDEEAADETPALPEFDGPMIEGRGIRKAFGTTQALDDLAIEVHTGEVHGFLGPNGAGKTTLLRILLGLVQRDEGVLTVMGLDPWHDAVRLHQHIAYVPGDVQLWPHLTGGETIDLLLRMRKVRPSRRDELIERFDLDPAKRIRDYSKGNRQKVALVAAFAADVPLYLFDEPTDGLDPLMAQVYRECVTEAREAGGTVLLSSHIMSEVEAIADRITILRSGRTVETGTLAELRHLTRTRVTATTSRPVVGLESDEHVHDLVTDGDRVSCDVGPQGLATVLAAIQTAGPVALDCRPPSLEEIFLRHYGADPATQADEVDEEADGGSDDRSGEAVTTDDAGSPHESPDTTDSHDSGDAADHNGHEQKVPS
ncbi:MAG: ABC transporter ATP-binding protein [Candidatus Nanopelagicales bacterium]